MEFEIDSMLQHYAAEAKKHGLSGTSTIQDMRTRRLERNAIGQYLQDGQKILEPGCGNGFTAWSFAKSKRVSIDAYDLCSELITLAQERSNKDLLGSVNFFQDSACRWKKNNSYDIVFTERALQNIPTWEDQCIALENIYISLKSEGIFVMEECFLSGLSILNRARDELDLPNIEKPWHNLFFDDEVLFEFMSKVGFKKIEENNFLSGYYFGSRVLLAALYPKHKQLNSSSILNDYFCNLPPAGNFCPMRIVVFQKP